MGDEVGDDVSVGVGVSVGNGDGVDVSAGVGNGVGNGVGTASSVCIPIFPKLKEPGKDCPTLIVDCPLVIAAAVPLIAAFPTSNG
jgi:hypothetical protein